MCSSDLLGVLGKDADAWFRAAPAGTGKDQIEALITERTAAKKAKNFAEADRIRKVLLDQGVVLEDGAQGTTWRRAS